MLWHDLRQIADGLFGDIYCMTEQEVKQALLQKYQQEAERIFRRLWANNLILVKTHYFTKAQNYL
jgi:hypothetical protein